MGSSLFQRLVALVLQIGPDPTDSSDIALQKRLAVALSLVIVPFAALWSAIYFAGRRSTRRHYPRLVFDHRAGQHGDLRGDPQRRLLPLHPVLMFLLLPWLLMMSLGGFKNSSSVIIWAALCPLGRVVLEDLQRTFLWLLGFIGLLVVSAVAQPYLTPVEMPESFVTWFFVLNIGAVILIGFGVLSYFVRQRNFFRNRRKL